MGINSSEQKMEAFSKIAVIVIGGGQVQIKRPMLCTTTPWHNTGCYQLFPNVMNGNMQVGTHVQTKNFGLFFCILVKELGLENSFEKFKEDSDKCVRRSVSRKFSSRPSHRQPHPLVALRRVSWQILAVAPINYAGHWADHQWKLNWVSLLLENALECDNWIWSSQTSWGKRRESN